MFVCLSSAGDSYRSCCHFTDVYDFFLLPSFIDFNCSLALFRNFSSSSFFPRFIHFLPRTNVARTLHNEARKGERDLQKREELRKLIRKEIRPNCAFAIRPGAGSTDATIILIYTCFAPHRIIEQDLCNTFKNLVIILNRTACKVKKL
jgi:hypothetical protein